DIARYSPIGLVMALGASWDELRQRAAKREAEGRPAKGGMADLYEMVTTAGGSVPLIYQTKRVARSVSRGDWGGLGIQQAETAIPAYSTLRDVYKGHEGAIRRAAPWLEQYLGPQQRDVLGRVAPDQGFWAQALHFRQGEISPVLDEMLKH